jgi:hypothetical protein
VRLRPYQSFKCGSVHPTPTNGGYHQTGALEGTQAVEPATVCSLDAIQLGTALQSRPALTSFVTYDRRLLDTAQTEGLPVDSPA